MSPIDGVSDKRWLPRLGKIRLGLKKEGQKAPYPMATDYFVCPDEVKAVFGEQPKELKIMFPNDDMELVAPQFLKCYSYSQGLICRGNGRTCRRKVDTDTGDFANRDTKHWELVDSVCDPSGCPMLPAKQCRRVMSLLFILPDVPGLGVYQLDTSSFYSIVNLNSQLAPDGFLRNFTKGRIAFIPLTLAVEPQEVTPPGIGRKTVHILTVRAEVKLADIIRISRQRPTQVLLPTLNEEEPPEDLYPEEVIGKADVAAPAEEGADAPAKENTTAVVVQAELKTSPTAGARRPKPLANVSGPIVRSEAVETRTESDIEFDKMESASNKLDVDWVVSTIATLQKKGVAAVQKEALSKTIHERFLPAGATPEKMTIKALIPLLSREKAEEFATWLQDVEAKS